MSIKNSTSRLMLILAIWLFLATVSCSPNTESESNQATPTPTLGASQPLITPTPTLGASQPLITPTVTTSLCSGLIGEFEVQVLVGPAEAVGLEPISIGYIPFDVTVEEPYLVQGSGQLEYADILIEEWGSYEVSLLLDTKIDGECVDTGNGGELNLEVETTGTQMVEVIADDFHGEYPWEGTVPLNFSVPLEEGASMEGEGWAFILHLPGE